MDASRLLNNDESNCTATSMYLSFDEECTISNSFKTLDTINEISDASNASGNSQIIKDKDIYLMDDKNNLVNSPLKSVNTLGHNYNSPIKSMRKSLREFKAVSSTPSEEHFFKNIAVMSSDDNQTLSHDMAFQAAIPEVNVITEDNKENVTPEMDDGISILSIGETPYSSTIEKTVRATSNNGDENQFSYDVSNNHNLENNKQESFGKCHGVLPHDNDFRNDQISLKECPPKDVDLNERTENIVEKIESTSALSMKPSRILPPGHRKTTFQLNDNNNDVNSNNVACLETELSSLIDKMVKISNTDKSNKCKETKVTAKTTTSTTRTTTYRTKVAKETKLNNKTKESTIKPMMTFSGDKRRHNVMPRVSAVMKTTLNSPARKAARKSFANGMSSIPQHQRRSILPLKSSENPNRGNSTRRTMLPKMSNVVPMSSTNTNSTLQVQGHVITSTLNDKPMKSAQFKPDNTFICNVCKEKFRIKSLMDAHKRSHEVDIPNVSSKKKVSSTATTPTALATASSITMPPPAARTLIFGHNNQCKYCDKKFALLRTLHIHLLQNCPKIPPADKRKLNFTEMDHVGKAQLPSFGNGLNKSETKRSFENSRENISGTISKEASSSTSSLDSNNKSKQIPAHSGVVFTPRKLILCHSCKLKFKSILDYTDHNISVHCKKSTIQMPIFE